MKSFLVRGMRHLAPIAIILAATACSAGRESAASSSSDVATGGAPIDYTVTAYRGSAECDEAAAVQRIGADTPCDSLSDTDAVESVRVRGQCIVVRDRSVRWTCRRYAPGGHVLFGSSTCADDSLIMDFTLDACSAGASGQTPVLGMISNGVCLGCGECAAAPGTLEGVCDLFWAGGP